MAQSKISLNLSSADFTLSYKFKGPSVIIPGQDQNYFQATAGWSGDTAGRGINIPQMAYCENTIPTSEGYRSVAYKFFIDPPETPGTFTRVLTVFDGEGNSALIGVTVDRRLYIVSAYTAGKWQALPIPGGTAWFDYQAVSSTTVQGFIGILIKGLGLFVLNVGASALSKVTPIGLDDTLINGICASVGYLIAYDDTTIYWSSTENPLDFTPSLITGAGSAKPDGAKGKIVFCKEIEQGFIIYCDVSIISAAYSSNGALPFIFAILQGGAGIRHAEAVAYDINMSNHFAWTSAGLIGVELHKANVILPQVTDFVASGLTDTTLNYTDYPNSDFDGRDKEVRLAIVSSRYLFISFGYNSEEVDREGRVPELIQSFVYDMQLKRWGKLNVDHIQIFETPFTAAPAVFF